MPVPRFSDNDDCQDAYRNYLCWINFPRCDDDGNSMAMCRSACENMMIACRYEDDLWRCGKSEFFNADSPEEPDMVDGEPVYHRDFYPGQPFVDNKFTSGRQKRPIPVCTPSLNEGASLGPAMLSITLPLLLVSALLYHGGGGGSA